MSSLATNNNHFLGDGLPSLNIEDISHVFNDFESNRNSKNLKDIVYIPFWVLLMLLVTISV